MVMMAMATYTLDIQTIAALAVVVAGRYELRHGGLDDGLDGLEGLRALRVELRVGEHERAETLDDLKVLTRLDLDQLVDVGQVGKLVASFSFLEFLHTHAVPGCQMIRCDSKQGRA